MSIASKVLCTLTVASLAWPISHLHAQPAGGIIQPTDKDASLIQPIELKELEKKLGGRTLLSLKLRDATMEEVAAAMSQSSGLKIAVRPAPAPPKGPDGQPLPLSLPHYSLEAKEQPLWVALFEWNRIARAAEIAAAKAARDKPPLPNDQVPPPALQPTPRVGLETRTIGNSYWLSPGSNLPSGRSTFVWPLFLLATNIQRTQESQLETDPDSSQIDALPLTTAQTAARKAGDTNKTAEVDASVVKWNDRMVVNLSAFFDPKIKALPVTCVMEEATDDRGNDLLPAPTPEWAAGGFSYSTYAFGAPFQVSLQSRPNMGKLLKKLRGALRFVLPLRYEKWDITDLNTPAQRQVSVNGDAYQISFEGMKKTNDVWQAKFSIYGEGNALKQVPGTERMQKVLQRVAPGAGALFSGGFEPDQNQFGLNTLSFTDEEGHSYRISASSSGGRGYQSELQKGDAKASPPKLDMERWTYSSTKEMRFSPQSGADENEPVGTGANGAGASGAVGDARTAKQPHIIINIPVEKREVIVPFEFTDLPLPPS